MVLSKKKKVGETKPIKIPVGSGRSVMAALEILMGRQLNLGKVRQGKKKIHGSQTELIKSVPPLSSMAKRKGMTGMTVK